MRREKNFYDQKKIFVAAIFAVVCTGAFVFFQFRARHGIPKESPRMITAILTGKLDLPLVPENISTIPLYHVHRNLWDTIVSDHGEPAIARLVDTEGQKIFRFEVLPDSKFSNGRKITSEDVLFSVNRLVKVQPGGHFNAKSIIENIRAISPSVFEISLKAPTPSFLSLLSIPEMGIVPNEICDSEGKIQRLDVTSGAYSVEGTPESERIVLTKNSFFKRADPLSPSKVTILFTHEAEKVLQFAGQDNADFIEIYESSGSKAFQTLRTDPKLEYKITRPSYSVFLSSNPKHVSEPRRLAVADLVSSKLKKYFELSSELDHFSFEVLPPDTFGSLGAKAAQPLTRGPRETVRSIKIGNMDKTSPLLAALVRILEDAKIKVDLVDANTSEDYDFALFGQGMNVNFPEIEFYLSMVSPWTIFESNPDEKASLSTAIHSSDRKVRTEIIQKIGSSLVADGRIIPLVVRSYAHVYRKGRIDVSQVTNYDGEIPFWLMKVAEK
jgi:MarR-like DNA-binding transcriptional regulator SgrR of sgrS sRNA